MNRYLGYVALACSVLGAACALRVAWISDPDLWGPNDSTVIYTYLAAAIPFFFFAGLFFALLARGSGTVAKWALWINGGVVIAMLGGLTYVIVNYPGR